jgi:hypothetical protein
MTDEDIVARVAELFGVTVCSYQPKRENAKRAYVTSARGKRAIDVLMKIAPLLGGRRRAQCEECIAVYNEKLLKQVRPTTDDISLLAAWANRPASSSFRRFAASVGEVTNRKALKHRLDRLLQKPSLLELPPASPIHQLESLRRDAYFAGLLEGEGYFGVYGNVVQVALQMTDFDIVESFAAYWNASVTREPKRRTEWKDCFTARVGGQRVDSLLRQIRPWMGVRRLARIEECLKSRQALAAKQAAHKEVIRKRYLLDSLRDRWVQRDRSLTLSKLAFELRVHPQSLKKQLLRLGVYDASPAAPLFNDVNCLQCGVVFSTKWNKPRVYCSRLCSIRGNHKHRQSSTPAANKPS